MVKFQQLFDTIIIIKGKVILMGLFGNIIKPLQGKLTTKQEENMKKVAEVFKEKTGKDYQTAVVWKMTTKKKLTKTVYTYYNWIIAVSYTHLLFFQEASPRPLSAGRKASSPCTAQRCNISTNPSGPYPVSYTHLDVYKRQGMGFTSQNRASMISRS